MSIEWMLQQTPTSPELWKTSGDDTDMLIAPGSATQGPEQVTAVAEESPVTEVRRLRRVYKPCRPVSVPKAETGRIELARVAAENEGGMYALALTGGSKAQQVRHIAEVRHAKIGKVGKG